MSWNYRAYYWRDILDYAAYFAYSLDSPKSVQMGLTYSVAQVMELATFGRSISSKN